MIRCCFECEKRCVGCHATCEAYIAEKAKHDAENEAVRKSQQMARYDRILRRKWQQIARTYDRKRDAR